MPVQYTKMPTVRTQDAPRAVAPADLSAARGLAGLGEALSGFFGAQANIQNKYDQIEHSRQLEEIKYANQEQKLKGIADVERGQEADPTLQNDRDYTEAYTSAIASKHSLDSANKFKQTVFANMGPGDDFDTAFRSFVAEETKNGNRTGTGNNLYDATFLKGLKSQTDGLRNSHETNQIKFQRANALDAHQSQVAAELPNLNPQSFNQLLAGRKAVMPWSQPSEVQASVWSDMMASAKTPADIAKLSVAMDDPAFGDGTNSFAKQFPEAADKLQRQLHGKYQTDIDVAGQKAWEGIDQKIEQATLGGDAGALNTLLHLDTYAVFNQHGGNSKRDQAVGTIQRAMDQLQKRDVGSNVYGAMLNGSMPRDISDAKKHQDDYFKKVGLDPMKNPLDAAMPIAKMGVINDNLKSQMSQAMLAPSSPDAFGAAYVFYKALEENRGAAFLADTMDSKAMVAYDFVKRQQEYGNVDPRAAAVQFQEISKQLRGRDRPKTHELLGEDTQSKGDKAMWEIIKSEITPSMWGKLVHGEIDPDTITGDAKNALKEMTMDYMIANPGDAKGAAQAAIKRALPNMKMFPGVNGTISLGRNSVKGGLKFGKEVFNPETGKTENTIQTYNDDIAALPTAFDNHPHLKGRAADDFSVDADSRWADRGLYMVKANQQHVSFGLGNTYQVTVGGKKTSVTIPKTQKEAEEILATTPLIDHDRFELVFHENGMLMLGYKPGFTGKRKTLQEQEAAYVQPKPKFTQGRSAAPAGGLSGRLFRTEK